MLPKALKTCPKSTKSANLVTLAVSNSKKSFFELVAGQVLADVPCGSGCQEKEEPTVEERKEASADVEEDQLQICQEAFQRFTYQ